MHFLTKRKDNWQSLQYKIHLSYKQYKIFATLHSVYDDRERDGKFFSIHKCLKQIHEKHKMEVGSADLENVDKEQIFKSINKVVH